MDDRIERTIETYETVAEDYQTRHGDRSDVAPVVEGFRERVATTVASEDDRPPRILDVGCGPGWESATFDDAGFETVGLDISPSFLDAAADRAPGASFLRGDMRSLPVAADSVDGVFALASLLHVPKATVADVLDGFARILADDGILTVVVKLAGNERAGSPYGDADRRHFEFYEPDEFRSRIEAAGFAVDACETGDGWIVVHGRRC